jgi:hypothetical protein
MPKGDKPNILNLQRLRKSTKENGGAFTSEDTGASDSRFSGVSPWRLRESIVHHQLTYRVHLLLKYCISPIEGYASDASSNATSGGGYETDASMGCEH